MILRGRFLELFGLAYTIPPVKGNGSTNIGIGLGLWSVFLALRHFDDIVDFLDIW